MAFVHGHPRDLGWVKAHRRRPNRAEGGQLPLIVEVGALDAEDQQDRDAAGPVDPDERVGERIRRAGR
jgi:hypothetical protein